MRPDDIHLAAMLAAAAAGTVALVAGLGRLSRDIDAHANEVAKLWAETDDIRTRLLDVGEDFVQALSSAPQPSGGVRR
jgi:hypothetical protein